jgi:hypothetical protein
MGASAAAAAGVGPVAAVQYGLTIGATAAVHTANHLERHSNMTCPPSGPTESRKRSRLFMLFCARACNPDRYVLQIKLSRGESE